MGEQRHRKVGTVALGSQEMSVGHPALSAGRTVSRKRAVPSQRSAGNRHHLEKRNLPIRLVLTAVNSSVR